MAIKLADTLAPMAGFPAVMAEHTAFEDGETLQEKYETGQLGGGGAGYTQLSQAEYDALTDDEKMNGKEYRTYDTGHIYKLGVEYGKDYKGMKSYTSLADLGLDTTATLKDITRTMAKGSIIMIKVDAMADQSEYNNITQGTVTIHKVEDARVQAIMTNKVDGRTWVATLGGENTIIGWTEITKNEILHTNLSGNLAGITTVLDLVNALLTEYRATSPKKPIRFVSGEFTKTNLTDLPVAYGLLQITVAGWDVIEVRLAHSANGFKTMYYGFVNRISGEESISSITWRMVEVPITELTDLGLDGSATIQDVMDKMSIGQHCIINTSRFDDKTQVNNIEYGKVEIRRLSSGMWSLWLEDVLHGSVVAHGTCSVSKFAGWHYFTTKEYVDSAVNGGTLGGKAIKSVEIDLSDDAYQPTSTAGVITMAIPNLSTTAKVIKAEGYYEDVDGDYFIVSANASGGAGTVKFASSKWSIAVNPVLGGRNKGYAKIYYVD